MRESTTFDTLYSEEDAKVKVIVPLLQKLGYEETDTKKHVLIRYAHPITVHQGRERKTIFADIVVFVNDMPLIVIDTKNPRDYLTENDREQVISYARLIGDIAPYSVLSNGYTMRVFDSITKQQIPALPNYRDLVRDIQKRRVSPRQKENIIQQATHTLFAIESARDLSRIMRQCHDVIRNLKGYDPTKAFDELSKILFTKMFEEREVVEGNRENNRFNLATIKEMRKQDVEIIQKLWQLTATSPRYREVFSDHDAESDIALPSEAIDKIVEKLEDKSLGLTDLDVKGVAFEEFLAATYRGGGLGQYFTPREVVNFMVELVDVAIGERVIDPSCGTGGFLIRVYNIVSDKIRNSELSSFEKQERLKRLANSCLVGIDWESRAARTCKMNMIIHGDGHAGVYQAHALNLQEIAQKVEERKKFYPEAPSIDEQSFDIVLTNPPFGADDNLKELLAPFELGKGKKSQKREVLLLERCIKLLAPGGRMAVVIPEGVLSNKNDSAIRQFILRECIVKAVIRLPQDTFKMSEGAACTSILYVIKKNADDPSLRQQGDIFFSRAEYIGVSPSGEPIAQNDLLAIKEEVNQFLEGNWDGLELLPNGASLKIKNAPSQEQSTLWFEPSVNRTSLLYDRKSYVLRAPKELDRFSYTYFHPRYYKVMNMLQEIPVDSLSPLQSLCVQGYPRRGSKPAEEALEGIPRLSR